LALSACSRPDLLYVNEVPLRRCDKVLLRNEKIRKQMQKVMKIPGHKPTPMWEADPGLEIDCALSQLDVEEGQAFSSQL